MVGYIPNTNINFETGLPDIWQISLNNTNIGTADFVIFDGSGLNAANLKLSAMPLGVNVSGTFGNDTLTFLSQITNYKAVRLKEIWLQSFDTFGNSNQYFFTNGNIIQVYASIANNASQTEIVPLVNQVHQNTFQTSIREIKGFRVLMDSFGGFQVILPGLTIITIVFYIDSVESTYDMNKI